MNIPAYLRRIHYDGAAAPTVETLRGLHVAHLLAVPFENLDIALHRSICLDEDAIFAKIVERNRGGFCYELNSLFAALLREIGFQVTLLSGRARRAHEYDHLTLAVKAADSMETWLADVGFGESFLDPLRLIADVEQRQAGGTFRLTCQNERWVYCRHDGSDWKRLYDFTLTPRRLSEFSEMCRYHQTSPESPFTQRRVCTLLRSDGRVTLADNRLIFTRNGVREEQPVASEEQFQTVLREYFGVVL